MECLVTFFVLLFMFVLAVRSTARGGSRGSRRRSYQQLAKTLSGQYIPGGLIRRPAVRLRYGETYAQLTEAAARGPTRGVVTQVQINWPDAKTRFELYPHTPFELPRTIRGFTRQASGDEAFDDAFVVLGGDDEEVRHLLSDGVQWQLMQLRELASDGLYVLIYRGRLTVQKTECLRRYENLEAMIQSCLALYDQAMITRAVGIDFVENADAQTLDDVICKVCGESINGDMVYCRKCKTPHHGECWQYVGGCSIYGCRETGYLRPQMAASGRVAPAPSAPPTASTPPTESEPP